MVSNLPNFLWQLFITFVHRKKTFTCRKHKSKTIHVISTRYLSLSFNFSIFWTADILRVTYPSSASQAKESSKSTSAELKDSSTLRGGTFFKAGYQVGVLWGGAKISVKIWGGLKIFLTFPEFTLSFLCFLGGGLKIFSENLRGLKHCRLTSMVWKCLGKIGGVWKFFHFPKKHSNRVSELKKVPPHKYLDGTWYSRKL